MDAVIQGLRSQWNIANMITAGRALAVLLALPLLYFQFDNALFVLVVLAVISDAEGYLARLTHTTTPLGRVFDPLADKLFVNAMICVYAVTHQELSVLVLLVVNLGYDIDNTSRRLKDIVEACLNRSAAVITTPVTWLSKTKTCVLFALVIVLYVPSSMGALTGKLVSTLAFTGTAFVLLCWGHNRKETIRQWFR